MLKLTLAFALATSSLAMSNVTANAQDAKSFRFCTASASGNYHAFGASVKGILGGKLPIELINTKGSMDNLEKLAAGECDGAMVQSDAELVYKGRAGGTLNITRIGKVFDEVLNLACNKNSGVDDIGDLSGSTKVAVGELGSGSWVSWNGLVTADKTKGGDYYSQVPTAPVGGALALNQVADGSDVDCMFFTSSNNSAFLKQIATASGGGSLIDMVDITDKDFNDTVDAKGNSIYAPAEVGYEGFGHWGDTDTYTVGALFMVNTDWMNANANGFALLNEVFLPVSTAFRAEKDLNIN